MPRIAVCSIASRNFFAHARAFFRSVKEHHPDWDCHFLLADEAEGFIDPEGESFSVREARDLGIPDFERMAFRYDVIEMNVALKPFLLSSLLARGYDRVLYFDVDMRVCSPLTPIVAALDSATVVVTPHITSPLPEDSGPTLREDLFLKNGVCNAGFIAVRAGAETSTFLDWWSARCARQCLREPETGLFVDQKWLDLALVMFPGVKPLRHLGCNMAYWNLHERRLSDSTVNGVVPLVFFHFSGLDLADIQGISKHQSRYNLDNRPDLRELFERYRETVLAAGDADFRNLPYRYGRFDNDDPIGLPARRLYESVETEHPHPFSTGSGTYHDILRRRGLLSGPRRIAYGRQDAQRRGRPINFALALTAKILGIARYEALMTYLRYISVLRRQSFLLR